MAKKGWEKVKDLYQEYGESISILVIDTELKYREFPIIVLNEIRAFTAHVSRIATSDFTDAQIDEQIKRAGRHILRIKLDLHKILCLWFADEYQGRFPEKYRNVPLDTLIINGTSFQEAYSSFLNEALDLTRKAKQEEYQGTADSALVIYESALSKYRELEVFFNENHSRLIELKRRYIRNRLKDGFYGFLLGILASVVANNISAILEYFGNLI